MVKPRERGILAKRAMIHKTDKHPFTLRYKAKEMESITGGGLAGDAPGGGCGCTQ